MNIDDLYFAAINGEKEKLIELLEANEVDVNEYIETSEGGEDIKLILMFSVIVKMLETKVDYEILDIFIRYGADIDKPIIIETDAYTRRIPLLIYAILQFNSVELTHYLLKRGANPNNPKAENYNRDYEESYPPLFFALQTSSIEYTKMLLYYGANPNIRVCTYNHEVATTQFIPLLFYATNNFLINKNSPAGCNDELTYYLIGYGADIYQEVISFIDNRSYKPKYKRYKFYDYLRLEYRGCERTVTEVLKKLNNRRFKPVPVSKMSFIKPEKRVQKVQQMSQSTGTPQSNYGTEGPIPLAEKMFAYYWENKYKYTTSKQKHKTDNNNDFDREWQGMGQKLTEFFYNWGPERYRWWEYNALKYLKLYTDDFMIYGPADRITEIREVPHVNAMLKANETITGEKLEALASNTSKYSIVLKEDLDMDKEYNIAELCFWKVEDGTTSFSYDVAMYTEAEIMEEIDSYERDLDSNERLHNALWRNKDYTNKEMFMYDKMDFWDYTFRDDRRSNKLYEYEQELRAKRRTIKELEDINIYNQYFTPIGLIAFSENEEVAVVLLYNDNKIVEWYKVDYEKSIFDIKQLRRKDDVDYVTEIVNGKSRLKKVVKPRDVKKERMEVIKNLRYYNIKWRNPFMPKPEYLSDEEWLALLYVSRYPKKSNDDLKMAMKNRYSEAIKEKQKTLNEGKYVW